MRLSGFTWLAAQYMGAHRPPNPCFNVGVRYEFLVVCFKVNDVANFGEVSERRPGARIDRIMRNGLTVCVYDEDTEKCEMAKWGYEPIGLWWFLL